jgi:hypothetical protein
MPSGRFYFILFIYLFPWKKSTVYQTRDGWKRKPQHISFIEGGYPPEKEGNGWAVKMTSGVEWSAISAFTRGEKPSLLSCPQTFPPFLLLSSGPSLILVHFFFFFLPLPPLFQLFSRSMTEATRQK